MHKGSYETKFLQLALITQIMKHYKKGDFTFEFHPELLEDLREINKSGMPSYEKLKNDDGIRISIRVIYESITD